MGVIIFRHAKRAELAPLLAAEIGSSPARNLRRRHHDACRRRHCQRGEPDLLGGGGVDGAIHRAAGPELLRRMPDAWRLRDRRRQDHRAVTGCRAKHVIHAVGPVWNGGGRANRNCWRPATAPRSILLPTHRLASIAFPAISTGIYGFPTDRAARIAVGTVASELAASRRGIERVVFCCFAQASADHHVAAFADLGLA